MLAVALAFKVKLLRCAVCGRKRWAGHVKDTFELRHKVAGVLGDPVRGTLRMRGEQLGSQDQHPRAAGFLLSENFRKVGFAKSYRFSKFKM